jgi:hypothetical protein
MSERPHPGIMARHPPVLIRQLFDKERAVGGCANLPIYCTVRYKTLLPSASRELWKVGGRRYHARERGHNGTTEHRRAKASK